MMNYSSILDLLKELHVAMLNDSVLWEALASLQSLYDLTDKDCLSLAQTYFDLTKPVD